MIHKRLVLFGLSFLLIFFCLIGGRDVFRFRDRSAAGAPANIFPRLQTVGRIDLFAPESALDQKTGSLPLLTELEKEEIAAGKYFQLIDEAGNVITATGHRLRPGDQYLDEKNRLYTVEQVQDYVAYARYIRTEKLKKPAPKNIHASSPEKKETFSLNIPTPRQFFDQDWAGGKEPGRPRRIIAIYHTHNDESYVPSDGVESVYGRGGIHAVGEAFKKALEEKNINVVYSEDLHLPHDRDAYLRARGTAVELLEHDPDAIFDIHRDAAPPETYAAKVGENWVTKIQFVVGQENPSFVVNRSFAYDLKALADEIYPGLIKGVLLGWGDFNQDLTPLNLLLEVGTHLNSKEEAQTGISLFADVVSYYFYGDSAEEDTEKEFASRVGAWGSVLFRTIIIVGMLVAAVLLGFYFLNNPAAWESLQWQLRLYLGSDGLVWQEGRKNLALLGQEIASAARLVVIYVYIFGGLLLTAFHRLKKRLKS